VAEDPISFIVKALELGAAAGAGKVATTVFTDSYTGLKELVRRRLRHSPDAERALNNIEQDPEAETSIIRSELIRAGAESDVDLVGSARRLIALAAKEADPKFATQFYGSADHVAIGDNMQVDMRSLHKEKPE
jgi:hypothetical protein